MPIFNNREIAVGIWFFIAAIAGATQPSIRNAAIAVLKAFLVRAIVIWLVAIIIYVGFLIYLLHSFGLWSAQQLKDTILWVGSVIAISIFRISSISKDQHFFRKVVTDNIKLVAVLQFLVSFYSFNLCIELVIVPISTLVGAMLAVAGSSQKYKPAADFLNYAAILLGLFLVAFAIYNVVVGFKSFATIQTLADFSLPPLLSLLYVPFLYLMSRYLAYDTAFAQLNFAIADPGLRRYGVRKSIISFRGDVQLLKRWTRNLMLQRPETQEDIRKAIRRMISVAEREKRPPTISFESGWSPYTAKDFLGEEGFKAGDYDQFGTSDDWGAKSSYVEIGDGKSFAIIRYYVDGDEFVARALRLSTDVDTPRVRDRAERRFLCLARILCVRALGSEMPTAIDTAIVRARDAHTIVLNKLVSVAVEKWARHKSDGYTLEFCIANISNEASPKLVRTQTEK